MNAKEIGLAIIGCGAVGRIRAEIARDYPGVRWLGVCDIDPAALAAVAVDAKADFATTSFQELLNRPEVTAVIVATEEHEHVEAVLCAVERGLDLFIEKPLATNAIDSAAVLKAIEASGVDAVVGYTQRFRRRFLAVHEKINSGQIGDVTTVVVRAFMNRMVPEATLMKVQNTGGLTPMVVSGTHSLDIAMWLMAGKKPVEVYARSVDRVLCDVGTKDATLGVFTMDDGTIMSMSISWALPVVWPGAVYGLEVGIVGSKGVIDIEDTHRDAVIASEIEQGAAYRSRGFEASAKRHVDFIGSYPPGDIAGGALWGAMREETVSWFARLCYGLDTPHATAAEGHSNLVLTMAMDRSAMTGLPVSLPISPDDLHSDPAGI